MTSEVVVMNRLGIALASDSASTVHIGGRTKFYQADKLFMLSNHQPVGLMVFNNATLLGVPWETIIKLFRARLENRKFERLSEYGSALIDFLNGSQDLFPKEVQEKYFLIQLDAFFLSINGQINTLLIEEAESDDALPSDVRKILEANLVKKILAEWKSREDAGADQCVWETASRLVGAQSGQIHKLIFKHFKLADTEVVNDLYELARLIICKKTILTESLSGIVIAGFGTKEHFPVMEEYHVGEIYDNKLKYEKRARREINTDVAAIIVPFAQSEMASTFLHGVSTSFEVAALQQIVVLATSLAAEIVDDAPIRSRAKKNEWKASATAKATDKVRSLVSELRDFREKTHLEPIIRTVEYLPKNELAHVAASLVNLNSLQKRISISEDETVGGPIDVAVISKGDGFVWVDRKHYFKPELNPHFFRNRIKEQRNAMDGDES